jgi:beta-galactosidase
MGKDHWNRKRVYSIRKFSIGVCSIVIGTCFLLFGASVARANPVYAEETRVLVAAEKPVEEKPVEEEVTAEPVTSQVAEPVVHSQEEKKEENPQLSKAAEDISAVSQNGAKENG